MAIGKEYLHPLEELAKQQRRLFDDAGDIGIWETRQNKTTIRTCLEGLKKLEGGEAKRWETGASYTTRLAFEQDGSMLSGVEVEVTRNNYRGAIFYTINIKSKSWRTR